MTMLEARRGKLCAANSSGYTGVYWDWRRGLWVAQIGFRGKNYYLGSYADQQEAVRARRRGEEMYDVFLEWYYSDRQKFEPPL